jgi:hypothetical protein
MGYSKEEFLETDFDILMLLHEESLSQFMKNYDKVLSDNLELTPQEYKFIKKDSTILNAIFSSRRISI